MPHPPDTPTLPLAAPSAPRYAARLAWGAARAAADWLRSWAPPLRLRDPGAGQPRRVAFLSFVEWDGAARQRPHHLARRMPESWRVAYISALRIHHAARSGRFAASPSGLPSLRPATPLAFPFERRSALAQSLNDRLVYAAAARALGGFRPAAVVVNSPALARPALALEPRVLIYDLMDEMTSGPGVPARYARAEALLFERADWVFTGTASLLDARRGRHPRMEFLQGGCDFEHFAQGRKERAPFGLRAMAGPVVGFFGALNDRLDGALLARLAAEPAWRLALVGPRYPGCPSLPPNAFAPGGCPYERLPDALAAFDAAIVPYRADGPTRYVNPVKTLEYLAGGKPVVSTALPDVERLLGQAVWIARDAGEFIHCIREALAGGEPVRRRIEQGRAMARARSWDAPAARLAEAIEIVWREKGMGV
ncbi:MAG: putative teichuronic acid biosynthesis glycosyltransferase TuaH [candidate division BRC1 bacterium ADurb.BinA364]|nr:MAG: putative teichuronic acid biosynthesis glycosyltransferase TuaH [candidate division BRC1 bacterium ADurb.BinA364]